MDDGKNPLAWIGVKQKFFEILVTTRLVGILTRTEDVPADLLSGHVEQEISIDVVVIHECVNGSFDRATPFT